MKYVEVCVIHNREGRCMLECSRRACREVCWHENVADNENGTPPEGFRVRQIGGSRLVPVWAEKSRSVFPGQLRRLMFLKRGIGDPSHRFSYLEKRRPKVFRVEKLPLPCRRAIRRLKPKTTFRPRIGGNTDREQSTGFGSKFV